MAKRETGLRDRVILLFLATALVVGGGFIIYRAIKYPVTMQRVEKLIKEKSEGLYSISHDPVEVDALNDRLILTNLRVIPDTLLQRQWLNKGDTGAQKVLLDIVIPRIEVKGFSVSGAVIQNQLVCKSIHISSPKIRMLLYPQSDRAKAREQEVPVLYRQLLGNMKLFAADSVLIEHAEVHAEDAMHNQVKFKGSGVSLLLRDIRVDSTYYHDTSRTFFSKYIGFKGKKFLLGHEGKEGELHGLSFNTDRKQLAFSSLHYEGFIQQKSFKVNVQDVLMNGAEWKGPAEYSELVLPGVTVGKVVYEQVSAGSEPATKQENKRLLSGWIKRFSLGKLHVQSFNFRNRYLDPGKRDINVNNSALTLQNIDIDSTAFMDESLFNQVKQMKLYNRQLEFVSEDKLYKFRLANLELDTDKKSFTIGSLRVLPQLGEAAFARRAKIQKDRFNVNVGKIICTGIDIGKLAKLEFYMKEVEVSHARVEVYRDLHYPPDSSSKVGKYPHQLLMQLDVPVKVNRVTVRNASVYYRENSAIADSIGVVALTNGTLEVQNARNVGTANGGIATANFTTSLIGKVPFSGKFTFYLDEWKKGRFRFEGSVDKGFDATVLNQLSIPLSMARIDKGNFSSIRCDINGDNYRATGTVQMTYRNLKISLLKRNDNEINRKTLFSLLANMLVKDNNRRANQRVSKVNFQRDTTRSIFNFTWKAIFSGGKEIMGIKP